MIPLLRKRRSIRKFRKRPVEPRIRKLLEESLLRSPSSRDIRPWHFIFIDDPALLESLSRCKGHGAGFLRSAPLGVVVCGDATMSDVWVEDCSIASILVQMAALSLGLGSCWIQVRNRKSADGKSAEANVREALGLPKRLRVESIIALGYPAEKKKGVPAKRLHARKIHWNRFQPLGR
jgi:nitroreductase